jgi:hypothetical protein
MSTIDDRLNQIIDELIASGITLEQAVEAFEAKYIVAAMKTNRGNVTKASVALGVHRNTLHNKLRNQAMLSGYVASIRPRRRTSKKASPKVIVRRRKARSGDGVDS